MRFEQVVQDFRNGKKIRIDLWDKGCYVAFDEYENVVDETDELYTIDSEELMSDHWELVEDNIDWQLIIEKKMPCWFWDNVTKFKHLSVVTGYKLTDSKYCFRDDNGLVWENCRPVKPFEVNFFYPVSS